MDIDGNLSVHRTLPLALYFSILNLYLKAKKTAAADMEKETPRICVRKRKGDYTPIFGSNVYKASVGFESGPGILSFAI